MGYQIIEVLKDSGDFHVSRYGRYNSLEEAKEAFSEINKPKLFNGQSDTFTIKDDEDNEYDTITYQYEKPNWTAAQIRHKLKFVKVYRDFIPAFQAVDDATLVNWFAHGFSRDYKDVYERLFNYMYAHYQSANKQSYVMVNNTPVLVPSILSK